MILVNEMRWFAVRLASQVIKLWSLRVDRLKHLCSVHRVEGVVEVNLDHSIGSVVTVDEMPHCVNHGFCAEGCADAHLYRTKLVANLGVVLEAGHFGKKPAE